MSQEAYIRHLIDGLIPTDTPPPDYYSMMRELHAIGVNLNQIARKANVLNAIDAARYDKSVAALNNAVVKITNAVMLPRKGWLGKVLIYTENPDKTENPTYFEKQGMTTAQGQRLTDVIDYASQTRKTQITDENAEILRHYVTGINCSPDTARDEMIAAKRI
jgi:hypothetical protein